LFHHFWYFWLWDIGWLFNSHHHELKWRICRNFITLSFVAKDQAAFKKAQDEYTKATDERKKKVEAQANELSQKYYGKFSEFSSRVGAFEAGDVKELVKEDLVEGAVAALQIREYLQEKAREE
jgi:ABC-type transport system substrate-binding protein